MSWGVEGDNRLHSCVLMWLPGHTGLLAFEPGNGQVKAPSLPFRVASSHYSHHANFSSDDYDYTYPVSALLESFNPYFLLLTTLVEETFYLSFSKHRFI